MPDVIDRKNPDQHTCHKCKREWIASNPNRNRKDNTVCTLCLTKNVEGN